MMRIIYVVCAAFDSGTCEEHVLDFSPAVPLACIHAAGPELDRQVPDGWIVERWHCAEPESDIKIAETPVEVVGR